MSAWKVCKVNRERRAVWPITLKQPARWSFERPAYASIGLIAKAIPENFHYEIIGEHYGTSEIPAGSIQMCIACAGKRPRMGWIDIVNFAAANIYSSIIG